MIWDTHTGEALYKLPHNHVVRAVAYPDKAMDMVATGGLEKKLRVWDIADHPKIDRSVSPAVIPLTSGFEIGEGTHTHPIKFICWANNPHTIITASHDTLRWFDFATRKLKHVVVLDGEIMSCEKFHVAPEHTSSANVGGGDSVMAVAAGLYVYFFTGKQCMDELARFKVNFKVASVAVDLIRWRFLAGEHPGTWGRIFNFRTGEELGKRLCLLCLEISANSSNRDAQGSSWPHMVRRLLSRWGPFRHGFRGRYN